MKRITPIFVLILFALGALPCAMSLPGVSACAPVVLDTLTFTPAPDQAPVTVTLRATPFAPDSPYYTDITLTLDDGRSFHPPVAEGYAPTISAFPFTASDRFQIFYAAATGGSGGFGYYFVFDVAENAVRTLFDTTTLPNPYTAQFSADRSVVVDRDGTTFLTFAPLPTASEGSDGAPDVSAVNFVAPSYLYPERRFRLCVYRKVTGVAQVDVYGYLIDTVDLLRPDAPSFAAAERAKIPPSSD